jgi:hypothetical protein
MHLIVKNHLAGFQARFAIDGQEPKQFEAFANYAIFRSFCAENISPSDLVYDGDDPGIDGVMIFVDDTFVSSKEEVIDAFKDRRRDAVVVVVFSQAKSSEAWSKSEINVFQSAITDFLSGSHAYPHSEYMRNWKEVFDEVLRYVGKMRDGKPQAQAFFITTGRKAQDREILAAGEALKASIENTGYFSKVQAGLVDRDSIVDLWTSAEGEVEAKLHVLGSAAFPRAPGIEEGYVLTVRAIDFIREILTDKNGRMRQRIFEENVRDFIGLDSDVNSEMAATLADAEKQKRFGILNNGITIISPDIRLAGFELFLRDFQIVNGCQTSNVLFENRDEVSDDATLMLKVVETGDPRVVDDVVRSTNRQAKVEEEQFLATLAAVKNIQQWFDAKGAEDEYRLFFERRKNQYSSDDIAKPIRVFDIKEIARCVAAMFLDKPDIASRYPNRLTAELREQVFNANYQEDIFHASAFALYRLKLHLSNKRIDAKYSKLRWHLLMAIKYYLIGDQVPQLQSPKIKKVCENIERFMQSSDEAALRAIKLLAERIVNIDEVTRDRLKGSPLVAEIRQRALELRVEFPPPEAE